MSLPSNVTEHIEQLKGMDLAERRAKIQRHIDKHGFEDTYHLLMAKLLMSLDRHLDTALGMLLTGGWPDGDAGVVSYLPRDMSKMALNEVCAMVALCSPGPVKIEQAVEDLGDGFCAHAVWVRFEAGGSDD